LSHHNRYQPGSLPREVFPRGSPPSIFECASAAHLLGARCARRTKLGILGVCSYHLRDPLRPPVPCRCRVTLRILFVQARGRLGGKFLCKPRAIELCACCSIDDSRCAAVSALRSCVEISSRRQLGRIQEERMLCGR
jgi:hypothetical protein